MELATARLKIEAQAERQTEQAAEIERLRAALADAQQGRTAAEQQAAVLAAKLEACAERVARAEARVEQIEQQAAKAAQANEEARAAAAQEARQVQAERDEARKVAAEAREQAARRRGNSKPSPPRNEKPMKDRDHNEAMAGMFQAEPRFAADYLRRCWPMANLPTCAPVCGKWRMLRVSRAAAPTDSAPSAGLFDRAGVRYEVACDVIGALIAHYAEIMGREREQAQPNEAVLRVAGAMKAALAGERDDLDPRDSAGIEAAISRYAPLARRLYGQAENDHARREQRRADFDQCMLRWP